MANVATLAYRVVADTSNFTKGVSATRREMAAAKKIIEETRTPVQKMHQSIAGLDQLYRKGALTTKQYFTALQKVKDESLKASGTLVDLKSNVASTSKTMGSMKAGIMSAVGSYVSWRAAISVVNEGLREQNRLSEEAHKVQMTAADAQAEVIKNLAGVSSDAEVKSFLTSIDEISAKAGMASVAPMYEAAASTLSATGGNQQLTQSILSQAAPLFRSRPTELSDFAGAVGDLASISGAVSPSEIRKTIGLVMSTQSMARITSLDAFKNVAPALAAVAAVDTGTDRTRALTEGGAAFAAIGGSIADPEGTLTKTATAQFATKLQELLPEKDVLGLEGQVLRGGTGMKTMRERLMALWGDEGLQREFLQGSKTFQKASFRGPIIPVIRKLVSDYDSVEATTFRKALATIKPDARMVDDTIRRVTSLTPELQAATLTQSAAGRVETAQRARGPRAAARASLTGALEQTRGNFFSFSEDKVLTTAFDTATSLGMDPKEAAKGLLGARAGMSRGVGATSVFSTLDETGSKLVGGTIDDLNKHGANTAKNTDVMVHLLQNVVTALTGNDVEVIGLEGGAN